MRIGHLTAYVIRLPLKRTFTHASATRQDSENVLVRCELAEGTTGWGEGVPRSYVTGETPHGCIEQLAATRMACPYLDEEQDFMKALEGVTSCQVLGESLDLRGETGSIARFRAVYLR